MKKHFFAKHAKSSAALISLGIHAVLIVIALWFVAVTVIQKGEQKFEAKPVNRPKMPMKKLQVPIKINKSKPKPKLRRQITVKTRMDLKIPDIKMPEITGVTGGIGSAGDGGLGGAGGIGFSMPEIDIFGVKGKGEKIFIVLDTVDDMLVDEVGGIPAYTIIKDELIRIVEELPPTALFNICVFQHGQVQALFSKLAPATSSNTGKVGAWLSPLNATADAAQSGNYGIKTLGPGGIDKSGDYRIGKFAKPVKKGGAIYGGHDWYNPVMLAMQQQADTVFLLSNTWGWQQVAINEALPMEEWKKTTSAGKKWQENAAKGSAMLAEENATRQASGQPPRVIASGEWGIVYTYFPDTERPPLPDYYYFKPNEFAEALVMMKDQHRPKGIQTTSGLGKKMKSGQIDFKLNVVQFVRQDAKADELSAGNFSQLTRACKGQYQIIAGLEEIKSYVTND